MWELPAPVDTPAPVRTTIEWAFPLLINVATRSIARLLDIAPRPQVMDTALCRFTVIKTWVTVTALCGSWHDDRLPKFLFHQVRNAVSECCLPSRYVEPLLPFAAK